jgi:CHAD domain-containing protein
LLLAEDAVRTISAQNMSVTRRANTARQRVSYPVGTLRAQVTGLDTAIAQVLARPKKDAVHGLRKATRKVEAQLEVIAALGRQEALFEAAGKPAKKVRKLLGTVRKAAGKVRDLDVQRRLAKEMTDTGTSKKIRKEAKELRRQLKTEREQEAEMLVAMLERHALKLEPRLERLLQELEPAAHVGMSAKELEVLTRGFYAARRESAEREKQPVDRMHGVRKAAKLARYMVEDGVAPRVVDEYEAVQESGGHWHDVLTLRDIAEERLGRGADLTTLLATRESEARREFEEMLAPPHSNGTGQEVQFFRHRGDPPR